MPITPGFPRRLRLEWIAANLRQDFFERHPYEAMRRRLLDELGVSISYALCARLKLSLTSRS